MGKVVLKHLSKWCVYSHLIKVFFALINGEGLSGQAKVGRNIALLGLFCPLFWYALFTGASEEELVFHATHLGIVFSIGMAIMLISLKQRK